MQKIPCPSCGIIAFWASGGVVEAKCPRCKQFVRAAFQDDGTAKTSIGVCQHFFGQIFVEHKDV